MSSAQCEALGFSIRQIQHKLHTGEWRRLHQGVYLAGPGQPSRETREVAALLAAGEGSALSHFTAARCLRLDAPSSRDVHVSVPMSRRPRCGPGVKLWRTRMWGAGDSFARGPFRITRLTRTVLDLASQLDDRWLRATLDSGLRLDNRLLPSLRRIVEEQGHGRRGVLRLQTLLRSYGEGEEVSDSALESFSMELGLGVGRKPLLHFRIHALDRFIAEVDLAWPEARLCVELDSWRFHGHLEAFERNRARDRSLMLLGWTVFRFTWRDITQRPRQVVDELTRAYESRVPLFRRS